MLIPALGTVLDLSHVLSSLLGDKMVQHLSAHLGEGQLLGLSTALVSINDLQLTLQPSRPPSARQYGTGKMTQSPLGQPRRTSGRVLSQRWLALSLRLGVCVVGAHTAHLCVHTLCSGNVGVGVPPVGVRLPLCPS